MSSTDDSGSLTSDTIVGVVTGTVEYMSPESSSGDLVTRRNGPATAGLDNGSRLQGANQGFEVQYVK